MDILQGKGSDTPAACIEARHWQVTGRVQGVGFRPFVFRLAHEFGLRGWVQNHTGQVLICTEGDSAAQEAFGAALIGRCPPLSQPGLRDVSNVALSSFDDFTIRASVDSEDPQIHVPPDCFTCDDCLAELNDPADRRYRYPFINCTQCGPRYTLIRALPYDRIHTSMAGFELCPACRREYRDPLDRRFHAEPVACPECGPRVTFVLPGVPDRPQGEAALRACVARLRAGGMVAVKGVGGYHLLCDARNAAAVAALRARKPRPDKPLAVMFPAPLQQPLQSLLEEVNPQPDELHLLQSPARPIVLVQRRGDSRLADAIAPGLPETGVLLPYSPLHHLLLNDFGGPLVATSGNISGEPVLTDADMAEQRLAKVADAFLHHDRPIVRPADDPVCRRIAGRPRPLRLGRGNAPLELDLPFVLEQPLLAVGGHTKNTLCLAWGSRAVLSPHIGDMGSARSLEVFGQVALDLQHLYAIEARQLLCDAHPGYATTRWAQQQRLPVTRVLHHSAHASALLGEQAGPVDDCLVFTWDGVGLGADGTLWGGEALHGRPGHWQRVASMRPFHLPGGEKAGREPWRSAVSLAWETGNDQLARGVIDRVNAGFDTSTATTLLRQAWQKRLNTPQTSAVGRLFDAAAALGGVCIEASFEGQGPMWLEALATEPAAAIDLPLITQPDGLLLTDWAPLVEYMASDGTSLQECASVFHTSMAETLLQQAVTIRQQRGVDAVGLCGGVFQNRRLTEECVDRLQANGFEVLLAETLPVNDAALSFGQIIEYANAIAIAPSVKD